MRNKRLMVISVLIAVLTAVTLLSAGCGADASAIAKVGGLSMVSRTGTRYFEVYREGKWQRYLIRGADIGASVPGHWFGEVAGDKKTYAEYLENMAGMNANTILVYTLLSPQFYEALDDFNKKHKGKEIRLIQQIWPRDQDISPNLYDTLTYDKYKEEIDLDIDAVMGKANIEERIGLASGKYTRNVMPYILGILVGREILADEVKVTNARNANRTGYEGGFARTVGTANPIETWCAEMADRAASYAHQTYSWAVPVGYVSWPSLDPLDHPTESTPGQPKENEMDDSQVLNPNHLQKGPRSVAGFYGAFTIYPHYPEFMYREPSYAAYTDEQGVLRYGGYLREFMSILPAYPAVVGEFGLSTSLNTSHLHPEGMGHGAVEEQAQGVGLARMYRAILREGYAGGCIFECADEWAKKNWVSTPYMIPWKRHVLWHNVVDPEQCFGIQAFDPVRQPFKEKMTSVWQAPVDQKGSGVVTAVLSGANEEYLYLELDFADGGAGALRPNGGSQLELAVGIDTLGPDHGTVRLPVPGLPDLPTGAEFLLYADSSSGAHLLARPDYNRATSLFSAAPANDPSFEGVRFTINREQKSLADGTYFPSISTDQSVLHYGVFDPADRRYDSLSHWYVSDDGKKALFRLPWQLLNVSDPSSHMVLYDTRTDLPKGPGDLAEKRGPDAVVVRNTTGFRFYAATTRAGDLIGFGPRQGNGFKSDVAPYLWPGWENPSYTVRLKKSYPVIKELYGDSEKYVPASQ